MPIHALFQPIEAMRMRRKFGEWLDTVQLTNRRYVIERRGQAKALLVPLTDGAVIAEALRQQGSDLDATYAALDRMKGAITDPAMRDASTKVDDWLYRDRHGAGVKEGNGE